MKYFHALFAIAMFFLLSGCITVFVPVETPTSVPTAISLPVNPTPTQSVIASPTSIQPAPLCSVDPFASVCALPEVTTLSKLCVKKVPYTLVALPPESTFEVVDPGLVCRDEGLRGGKRQISCTGPQLYSYDLKVCNSACSVLPLETGTAYCEDGYGYSADAGCCWPVPVLEAGCILYKVDISACN